MQQSLKFTQNSVKNKQQIEWATLVDKRGHSKMARLVWDTDFLCEYKILTVFLPEIDFKQINKAPAFTTVQKDSYRRWDFGEYQNRLELN